MTSLTGVAFENGANAHDYTESPRWLPDPVRRRIVVERLAGTPSDKRFLSRHISMLEPLLLLSRITAVPNCRVAIQSAVKSSATFASGEGILSLKFAGAVGSTGGGEEDAEDATWLGV